MRQYVERVRALTRVELAVLIAGVASMGLEILAGRLVAPSFGSSIYTWGSIIGVFLAALSLGYYRGGRRAAADASHWGITTNLLYAALYVGVVVFASEYVLELGSALPVPGRFVPLVPVAILFGPPVYLLGYVSPYAAELSERETTGDAAGHVYALGTLGSIVGAFGTTFVLLPWLDVEVVGFLFGSLLVLAAVGLAVPAFPRKALPTVALVSLVLVASVAGSSPAVSPLGDVVYHTQTPYQELQVVDRGGERVLYLDGQRHSAMDTDRPNEHVFDYTRYFHLPLLMREDVDRVLFVGGGGFTGPKIFAAKYGVTVDVVEIDPEVVRVAKRYFGVEESPRLNVHVQDGRRYLRETDRKYDLIVLDAYKKDKVPFHLTTAEFMSLAADRLDEDGILLANIIAAPAGPGSKLYRAEYRTMRTAFPRVYAFTTSETDFLQNVILIGTKDGRRLSRAELRRRNRQREIGVNLSAEIDHMRTGVDPGDVPVLRDEKAPVERLMDPMYGRKYVIERNGTADPATG